MEFFEVTEAEFWAAIGPQDLVGRVDCDEVTWETRDRLRVAGKSIHSREGRKAWLLAAKRPKRA